MPEGDSSRPGSLNLTGLPILTAPGADSNYLDWEWKVKLFVDDLDLGHVLLVVAVKDRPSSWDRDNIKVSSIILRTVEAANNRYVRPCGRDAHAMWLALQNTHKDSSAGGRLYWLHRLVTAKMEGDNVMAHLKAMHRMFEHLDSLITTANPLTADDVFTAALLVSLPNDWLPVVTPLMQRSSVSSSVVIQALSSEAT